MRILTSGESHGKKLTGIIEGFPAHFPIDLNKINQALAKRQKGYGRGGRMKIEHDHVQFTSGVRNGITLGSPIALEIQNNDYINWKQSCGPFSNNKKEIEKRKLITPRPGHGDLVGGQKRQFKDLRNVLERASARETAIRVAIGEVCRQLLESIDIQVISYLTQIGELSLSLNHIEQLTYTAIQKKRSLSCFPILQPEKEEEIKDYITDVKRQGDTLGGIIAVHVFGLPVGLGDYTLFDQKLDGKLAQAVLSLNAFKGVEFGEGFSLGKKRGSQVMDEILYTKEKGYFRKSNHLGGLEAGMTNGMPLILRGVMKPIPTLNKPLQTVNIENKSIAFASKERSDVIALEAASLVLENVIAITLCQELLKMFPSFEYGFFKQTYHAYLEHIQHF